MKVSTAPKTLAKFSVPLKICIVMLLVLHTVQFLLDIYFWFAEDTPNVGFFTSVLAIPTLVLGYYAVHKKHTKLLLAFALIMIAISILMLGGILIALGFFIGGNLGWVQLNVENRTVFNILMIIFLIINITAKVLIIICIICALKLRRAIQTSVYLHLDSGGEGEGEGGIELDEREVTGEAADGEAPEESKKD